VLDLTLSVAVQRLEANRASTPGSLSAKGADARRRLWNLMVAM
jgi:hypothetical protein